MAGLERRLEALEAEQKRAAAEECRAILERLSDHELAQLCSPFVRQESTGEEAPQFNAAEQAVVDKIKAKGLEQHLETAIGYDWQKLSEDEVSRKVNEVISPICKLRKNNKLVRLIEEYAKEDLDDQRAFSLR